MTTEIEYFEDFDSDIKRIEFCEQRDIDFLPLKDSLMIWERRSKEKHNINKKQIISKYMYVFEDCIIEKFEEFQVLFLANTKDQIIGVVHFSDYRNVEVYTYLFRYLYYLEDDQRNKWIKKHEITNTKSHDDVNGKGLRDLIREVNEDYPYLMQSQWCSLRNIVCHIKHTKKQNKTKYFMHYDFKDFKEKFFKPAQTLIKHVEEGI